MAPSLNRSLLLATALLACAAISQAAGPQTQGPPASGMVELTDSPDDTTGEMAWVTRNNSKNQRDMSFVTPEEEGLDRAFNVRVYNSSNIMVGYYGLNPSTGNTVPVPGGGYVVLEDDNDKNDDSVTVGWWWAD